jgi:indolepyruvate ferredoxin oxidoreductase beta subunit
MTDETKSFHAVRIFFTGVGGQGTLLATRLVGEAALEEGLPVTISEIHGMAQRGGVVESSVVAGEALSPTVADGEADILMAFEPLEALRALPKCHPGSLVIASTVAIVPFTVGIGQAVYPNLENLFEQIRSKVSRLVILDPVEMGRQAGSELAANLAMLGVLAGAGGLPISAHSWQEALQRTLPPRLLEINRKAFSLGVEFATRIGF